VHFRDRSRKTSPPPAPAGASAMREEMREERWSGQSGGQEINRHLIATAPDRTRKCISDPGREVIAAPPSLACSSRSPTYTTVAAIRLPAGTAPGSCTPPSHICGSAPTGFYRPSPIPRCVDQTNEAIVIFKIGLERGEDVDHLVASEAQRPVRCVFQFDSFEPLLIELARAAPNALFTSTANDLDLHRNT